MGKSAGKWMKSLIYRMKGLLFPATKKSSKPKLPDIATHQRVGYEEELWIASKSLEGYVALNPTSNTDLTLSIIQKDDGRLANNQGQFGISVPDILNEDFEETTDLDGQTYPELIRLETAAIKIQAALRGYLARRAFRALKDIVTLQALVRGHLVRRQAVSTLYCMLGVVKIQALARGKRIRHYHNRIQLRTNYSHVKPSEGKLVHPVGVDTSVGITKLPANVFARKLLPSSPMPLLLQYGSGEANSVLNWLERWSASQIWKPVSQKKQVQQKSPLENADSVSSRSSEFENTRRIMRKYSIPSAYFVNEDPHHELEKVKRSLRKVHNPIVESTVQSETENERLRHCLRNDLSTGQDDSELMVKDVTEAKLPDIKRTLKPLPVNGSSYMVKDDQIASKMDPLWNIEEDGRVPVKNEELTREGDLTSNETKKLGRRPWFQAKQGVMENQLRSRSILPSYMAVTESAKAKLRAQSSPTSGQDAFEKHNLTRYNSANVRGGNKSPLSSGNGNVKVSQVEWRR